MCLLVVPSCSLLRDDTCCASCLVSSRASCGCKSANSGKLLCDGVPAFVVIFMFFFVIKVEGIAYNLRKHHGICKID